MTKYDYKDIGKNVQEFRWDLRGISCGIHSKQIREGEKTASRFNSGRI